MRVLRRFYHQWQRLIGLFFCLACLFSMPGCWVFSVNSLYEGNLFGPRDRDIVFDSNLVGTWKATKDDCVTTLAITSTESPDYVLTYKKDGKRCDTDSERKELQFEAKLVKLDSHVFLDVSPKADDVCPSCLAAHQIFLIALNKDTLNIMPIDSEWLKDAIEKKKIDVSTVSGNTDILTGSSKELKQFCRDHADDRKVFKPDPEWLFKRS